MDRITWLRRMTIFVTSATMAGFGLTGIASAQTITNTGPGSTNRITSDINNDCTVKNNNDVSVNNVNRQTALTGDASQTDNTDAASWTGWATLDPSLAQADGVSHDSWWNGVVAWMAQHATGNGWNSSGDNLAWTPSGNDWAGFDPMTWQANGQSFGNWWNGTESFMNANSPMWLLNWPANATGDGDFGGGGATTGDATNNNNSDFSISINNAGSTATAVNACGQRNFVTPPVSAGQGAGPAVPSKNVTPSSSVPQSVAAVGAGVSGANGVGAGGGQGSVGAPQGPGNVSTANVPVKAAQNAPAGPSAPSVTPNNAVPKANQAASISNTGPNSSNVISSQTTNTSTVKNTNDISVSNSNYQTANTGNATASGNTTAGDGGSGHAANGNGTGLDANLSN